MKIFIPIKRESIKFNFLVSRIWEVGYNNCIKNDFEKAFDYEYLISLVACQKCKNTNYLTEYEIVDTGDYYYRNNDYYTCPICEYENDFELVFEKIENVLKELQNVETN